MSLYSTDSDRAELHFLGVQLDRVCESCEGACDNGEGDACLRCAGSGFEATEAGAVLLRFIERHAT